MGIYRLPDGVVSATGVSGCHDETSEKFRRSHRFSSSSSIRIIFDYEVDDEEEDD
jgi:hypothetical protein